MNVACWSYICKGKKFTWANNKDNLVMSLIDRMFVSTEFGKKISSCYLYSLTREHK